MDAVTRKLGPLPVWAWALVIGGTFLAVRFLRGGSSGAQDATVQMIPTGAPDVEPSAGFLNDLSFRLDNIESALNDSPTGTQTPPPNTSGGSRSYTLLTLLRRARKRFPKLAAQWEKAPRFDRRKGESLSSYRRRELAFYARRRGAQIVPPISAKP